MIVLDASLHGFAKDFVSELQTATDATSVAVEREYKKNYAEPVIASLPEA